MKGSQSSPLSQSLTEKDYPTSQGRGPTRYIRGGALWVGAAGGEITDRARAGNETLWVD